MENNTQISNVEDIKNLIYTIRGRQVMLDSDVANLYECETKYVNRVVKRNIERFPKEFCFQLTESEFQNLRCQFVTSSFEKTNYGGRRYLPYVFTEQGIAMLSALINSKTAINVSINIMKAFIEMRRFILSNGQIFERITTLEYKQLENEKNFDLVFNQLQLKEVKNQHIFFQGQIYDAYKLIVNLIEKAEKKIVIIDNYVDKSILDMLTKKKENVEVVIITSTKNNALQNLDIQKFNKQYPTLKLGKTNKFHDRFIIIDNIELYHCGASIKDMGKKCFGINKIEDQEYLKVIINNI